MTIINVGSGQSRREKRANWGQWWQEMCIGEEMGVGHFMTETQP